MVLIWSGNNSDLVEGDEICFVYNMFKARREYRPYKRSNIWSIENHVCMFSNHQDFVEELQGKEEEMSKVIKMADNFKEEAQVTCFFIFN